MATSLIEEIKSRLDIVDVISSYLNLKKVGSNYQALCPFHSEKKPSFFVSPRLQIFKCFGCGVGGDIFKFVMQIEGVEFGDALRILAKKAGVELKPIEPQVLTERKRLFEILELSTKFFEKQMEGKVGQKVKEYLISRGIKEESIKKWRLGWAPSFKNSLIEFLVSRGYKREEIKKAGLAIQRENGEFVDFFRKRIIFPIFDLNSQPIAFSGRIFEEEEGPKYINSPNTLLYDKGKTLYGLDKAKVEIKKRGFCILTEGYTDTILAHQEGFENTVALCGTSLTPFQLDILKRYTQNIYLSFDMDVGGDFATKRGIDLAREKGMEVKVLILPQDKDPADVISEDKRKFEEILKNAKPIMDYYFERATSKFDKKILEGKKEIVKFLLPEIKRIKNEIEREFWISKLSKELEISKESLISEMAKIRLEEATKREEKISLPQRSKKEILEERLLVLILKFPKNLEKIDQEKVNYFSENLKKIFEILKENQKPKIEQIPIEARDFFATCSLMAEIEEIQEEKASSEIEFCQREIYLISLREKLKEISEKLKEAEAKKDLEKIKEFSKEFLKLSQKISKI